MRTQTGRCRGVLVTRPQGQNRELGDAVRLAGGAVFELPTTEIVGFADEQVQAQSFAADIVIFVSQNAVRFGARVLENSKARIAAIGPATKSALQASGFSVDIWPLGRPDSDHLLAHPALSDVRGARILIVRGTTGREHLMETLTERGALVRYLAVYERRTARPEAAAVENVVRAFTEHEIEAVIVMSVESLMSLLDILPATVLPLLRETLLVTPSERVVQTASVLLAGARAVAADGPQATQMVDAILKYRDDKL